MAGVEEKTSSTLDKFLVLEFCSSVGRTSGAAVSFFLVQSKGISVVLLVSYQVSRRR